MTDSNKEYQKDYYERKKKDPAFLEKKRAASRAYHHKLKESDPERYTKYNEQRKARYQEMKTALDEKKKLSPESE
jgi:hypothetical protein